MTTAKRLCGEVTPVLPSMTEPNGVRARDADRVPAMGVIVVVGETNVIVVGPAYVLTPAASKRTDNGSPGVVAATALF